jgi:hypothetical protein
MVWVLMFPPFLRDSLKEKSFANVKAKKKQRAYRCTDSMFLAIKTAAKQAEMSVNEWTVHILRRGLEVGVGHTPPIDLDQVGEMAKANAIDKLAVSIAKTESIFAAARKELGMAENE